MAVKVTNKINYKTIFEESKLRIASDGELVKLCIEMFDPQEASQRIISYLFSSIDSIEQRIRMVENINDLQETIDGIKVRLKAEDIVCPKCKMPNYIYFPDSKSYYCPKCDLMHKKIIT